MHAFKQAKVKTQFLLLAVAIIIEIPDNL